MAQTAFSRLGFIFRPQPICDYGIDAHIELVNKDGNPNGSLFALQIKSGASYFKEETIEGFIIRPDEAHVTYWLGHSLPVVALLCDTETSVMYWKLITRDGLVSTGTGWKLEVPRAQTVTESCVEHFRQIATRVISADRYSVLTQKDTSWAGAKRYSLEVLLNGDLSEAEIAAVIRQVTLGCIGSRYYRDAQVERYWQESNAHVVFLFVYATIDDISTANWICRSLWIDEHLPEKLAPMHIQGQDIGFSIITEWSDTYRERAATRRKHTLSKEDYLRAARKILAELEPQMETIEKAISREALSAWAVADEVFRECEPSISRAYMDATRIGLAPIECRYVDRKLQAMAAAAHNLVLPFCDFATQKARNNFLETLALEDFKQNQQELRYELNKIR